MRLAFLGSPTFALPSLNALLTSQHEVVAVVTQPDRPAGRGHAPSPPPMKSLALAHGLDVMQPERVSDPESVALIRALQPDVLIVAAYGQILRQRLLDVPRRGALNVHASLLPRHRGASPVTAAILAGDPISGVTIMEMVRALDAGPIVARVEEPVSAIDTAATLEPRLAAAGARLLLAVLDPWAEGRLPATPQEETLATYAPLIKREEALIDWTRSALELWRRVKAFNPWPVAHTTWQGAELRIFEAWPLEGDSGREPGTVLEEALLPSTAPDPASTAFSVQTGSGRLAVISLQRSGRRAMGGAEFLRGQRGLLGDRLGT